MVCALPNFVEVQRCGVSLIVERLKQGILGDREVEGDL